MDIPVNIYKDGSYLQSNPTWHEEHSAWKAAKIGEILADNRIVPDTIAEVGCGAGQILVELANSFPDVKKVSGYEISPQAFDLCSGKANDCVQFYHEDIFSNPPDERYDVALAIDVFEHVEDYIGFVRNMKKIGRYQVFHIPLELSVSSILRPSTLSNARSEVGHIHFFTRDTALATLELAGLKIVDVHFTSVAIDHANGAASKIARFPRVLLQRWSADLASRILGGFHILVLTE